MTMRQGSAGDARPVASRWLRRELFAAGGLTLAGAAMIALAPAAGAQVSPPPTPGPVTALLDGVGGLIGAVTQPVVEQVMQAAAQPVAPAPTASVATLPTPDPAPASAASDVPTAPTMPPPGPVDTQPAPAPAAANPATPVGAGDQAPAPVTTPLGEDVVHQVAEPPVDALAPGLLGPLADAADPLSPVLDSVASAVLGPVPGSPALDAVSPLLDAVLDGLARALLPLTAPVTDAVLGPVPGAVGGTPVSELIGRVLHIVRSPAESVLPPPTSPGAPGPPGGAVDPAPPAPPTDEAVRDAALDARAASAARFGPGARTAADATQLTTALNTGRAALAIPTDADRPAGSRHAARPGRLGRRRLPRPRPVDPGRAGGPHRHRPDAGRLPAPRRGPWPRRTPAPPP